MKKKIFNWIDKNKDTGKISITFLKLMYSLSFDWLRPIVDIFAAFLMTYYLSEENWTKIIITLVILLVISVWYSWVNAYKHYEYSIRKNTKEILNEISVFMTALDEYINRDTDNGEKAIFEYAADLVSFSMYDVFKKITGCEIRVSIIQQFHEYNTKRKCMMISRRSKNRKNCVKENRTVKYNGEDDYYYLKILSDNEEVYIYFDEKEIFEKFCNKNNKKKQKIFQYIGIPEKVKTNDVAFLLQIDGMEKNSFGKNKNELESFVDNYVLPYIHFLRHAYNIERKLKENR